MPLNTPISATPTSLTILHTPLSHPPLNTPTSLTSTSLTPPSLRRGLATFHPRQDQFVPYCIHFERCIQGCIHFICCIHTFYTLSFYKDQHQYNLCNIVLCTIVVQVCIYLGQAFIIWALGNTSNNLWHNPLQDHLVVKQ